MNISKTIIAILSVVVIISAVVVYLLKDNYANKNINIVNKPLTINIENKVFDLKDSEYRLYSTSTKIEEKIEIVKNFKAISLDETKDKGIRLLAGQNVTSSFFGYGMTLSKGFSDKGFSERDIYEYSKYLNTLGDSNWNTLNTAYVGLSFYSNEIDKGFVSELLRSHLRSVKERGTSNACYLGSRFSSVIYLSQKNKHTDVSGEFGDYYTNFENTFNKVCLEDQKPLIGFMWLAALSDIGKTEKENKKAKELVSLITKDKTENSSLVRNLKTSYFTTVKEPDTVSIVNRLVAKYPEFKSFIESIK